MKLIKLLFFTTFLLFSLSACWAANPLNILTEREDHQIHALVSYAITDVAQTEWKWAPWQSFLFIQGLGLLKESIDEMTGGKFDHTDIQANTVGWCGYNIIHFKIEL